MNRTHLGRRLALSGGLAASACLVAGAATAARPGEVDAIVAEGEFLDWDAITVCEECYTSTDRTQHAPFRAAFLAWLEEASGRFAMPVQADTAAEAQTWLRSPGLHPGIEIVLAWDHDISVYVTHSSGLWDVLASMDVFAEPAPCGSGWHNGLFIPEAQQVHPSVEACWRQDGFEALLAWVNSELVPATHVALHGETDTEGFMRWSEGRLVRDGIDMRSGRPFKAGPHLRALLPLHAALA